MNGYRKMRGKGNKHMLHLLPQLQPWLPPSLACAACTVQLAAAALAAPPPVPLFGDDDIISVSMIQCFFNFSYMTVTVQLVAAALAAPQLNLPTKILIHSSVIVSSVIHCGVLKYCVVQSCVIHNCVLSCV